MDLNIIKNIASKKAEDRTEEENTIMSQIMEQMTEHRDQMNATKRQELEAEAAPLLLKRTQLEAQITAKKTDPEVVELLRLRAELAVKNKEITTAKKESDGWTAYSEKLKEMAPVTKRLRSIQTQMKKLGGKLVVPRKKKRSRESDEEDQEKRARVGSEDEDEEDEEDDVSLRFGSK